MAREPQVRDLGKIFGGFPNLENLFVSVDRREMDCWKGGLRTTRIVPLVLVEDDAFPRLRSLSISGYYNVSKEASLWRELLPDTITLRTGENLRQFRQYRPDCFEMDYEFAKKIEIRSPWKEGDAPSIGRIRGDRDKLNRYLEMVYERHHVPFVPKRDPPLSRARVYSKPIC